jgi:3-oxoacyl-(acyl-carrier-protein) synthase III
VIPAAILGTGRAAGSRTVETEALLAALPPARDRARIRARLGITRRGWIGPGEDVASLATTAVRGALEAAGLPPRALTRVILATSTGGDQMTPCTANTVAENLGLDDAGDAFDLNNACVGFLTGLDLAARAVATGSGPVAVVASEVFSRYLAPERPRAWLVFGDAAAAAIVGPSTGGAGLLAVHLRNNRALLDRMRLPHPGVTRRWEPVDFDTPADVIAESAVTAIRRATTAALEEAGLSLDAIDWFLPHQPNGALFDAVVEACGVDRRRVVPIVDTAGSLGAAAVPFSLDVLWRSGRVRPGQYVLLAAVGAGTAYGAVVYRVGEKPGDGARVAG